jgi:hypothetical protein
MHRFDDKFKAIHMPAILLEMIKEYAAAALE